MAQLFQPGANTTARFLIVGVIVGLSLIFYAAVEINRSDYSRREGIPEQPVQFSHRHHVAELGIDCRYCHSSVQTSASAGMPDTHTCMSCHSQIWTDSPMLRPVRQSYLTGDPLEWVRVHDLPDFVYFDHSMHVQKGIGCETCHGRVDQMPLVAQVKPLSMQWCLDCHRNPVPHLRPLRYIFTFGYEYPENQEEVGQHLLDVYNIDLDRMDDCYTCHR